MRRSQLLPMGLTITNLDGISGEISSSYYDKISGLPYYVVLTEEGEYLEWSRLDIETPDDFIARISLSMFVSELKFEIQDCEIVERLQKSIRIRRVIDEDEVQEKLIYISKIGKNMTNLREEFVSYLGYTYEPRNTVINFLAEANLMAGKIRNRLTNIENGIEAVKYNLNEG